MMGIKPKIRNPKAERGLQFDSRIQRCASFTSEPRCATSDFEFPPSFGLRVSALRFASGPAAFTLIELILVMAILTMAVSVTAPTLANFFRGRTLDSEARRLLAMTHSGQNRAVSEGIPIDLWVDAENRTVGLEAEPSFETTDARAVEFELDGGVQVEITKQTAVTSAAKTLGLSQTVSTASVPRPNLTHPLLPTIRFLPDGTISETSPQTLRLSGRDGNSICVALAQDKLSYEIRHYDK
jgi:prepilin-type N-terminal cleavage/methylation domain-containing protein